MKPTQFEKDGKTIGLEVRDGTIFDGAVGGALAGANVTVDQAIGEPSTWTKLNTPMSRRGTVQGRATVFVTVTCTGGVTMIAEIKPKHQLAARRWAAQVNAMAAHAGT